MICAPVRRDNPQALARGLSTVQTHKYLVLKIVLLVQSNFNGSNTFGTMKISSRQG